MSVAPPTEIRLAGYPWTGDAAASRCDHAIAAFLTEAARDLVPHGSDSVDPPTLLTAAGTAAGRAARETLFQNGKPTDIVETSTVAGDVFHFGGSIVRAIFPESAEAAPLSLWPIAAGAAIAAGLPSRDLPEPASLLGAVARVLGSQCPTVSLPPDRWPAFDFDDVETKIARAYDKVIAPLPIRWRACVAANSAALCISVLGPAYGAEDALTIVVESALYATKRGAPIARQPHPIIRF